MNPNRLLALVFLYLSISCKVNHLANVQPQSYRMAPQSAELPAADPAIEALITPYKTKLDADMNQVIGTAAITLTKDKPESTLGNWLSDLLYEQINARLGSEIDFASINYGGIRIPEIREGAVTRGKIYELMPFDNMVTVVHADAATLQLFLEKIASSGGIPVSKQLRLIVKDGKPIQATIKGQPIQEDKIYKIGVSDYIANGGDDCSFFIDKKREDLGIFLRDAIIQYIEQQTAQGKPLNAALDQRIIISN